MTEPRPAGVWPCQHCTAPVVIRQIRDGRRWPFDRALLLEDDVPEQLRFVPVRAGHGVIMLPATDMAPRRLEGIRWFAQRHTCAAWLRWRDAQRRARRDELDVGMDIHDALIEALGLGSADETPVSA